RRCHRFPPSLMKTSCAGENTYGQKIFLPKLRSARRFKKMGSAHSSAPLYRTFIAAALLELEVRHLRRAVVELYQQLAAGAFPRLVGLPDVGVGVGRRVVAQPAVAGGDGFFDVTRRAAAAGHRLR